MNDKEILKTGLNRGKISNGVVGVLALFFLVWIFVKQPFDRQLTPPEKAQIEYFDSVNKAQTKIQDSINEYKRNYQPYEGKTILKVLNHRNGNFEAICTDGDTLWFHAGKYTLHTRIDKHGKE